MALTLTAVHVRRCGGSEQACPIYLSSSSGCSSHIGVLRLWRLSPMGVLHPCVFFSYGAMGVIPLWGSFPYPMGMPGRSLVDHDRTVDFTLAHISLLHHIQRCSISPCSVLSLVPLLVALEDPAVIVACRDPAHWLSDPI